MSDIMDDEAVEDENAIEDEDSPDVTVRRRARKSWRAPSRRTSRSKSSKSAASAISTAAVDRMIADQQRREGEEQWEADLRQGVANLSRQSPIPRNIDHWRASRQPWKSYVTGTRRR